MTETKTSALERIYIVPLRKAWLKKASYRRAGRASKALKQFIARHMKVPDHDTSKVKLDMFLNNEIWFRGHTKPPAKIKVRAVKDGEFVRVYLADAPDTVKFRQAKHERRHKASEKPKEETKKEEPKVETPEKEPGVEKEKAEKEKEQATAVQHEKDLKQQAKAQKHTTSKKGESFHRMALQK